MLFQKTRHLSLKSYVILVLKLITIKLLICNYYVVKDKYVLKIVESDVKILK